MRFAGKIFEALPSAPSDRGAHIGKRLREIRELSGLTQAQLAARLGIGQAALSRVEGRRDILVSTLKDYLAALGASLQISAHLDGAAAIVTSMREAGLLPMSADEGQLVLPLIGEGVPTPSRDVVFSIKPDYCDKIVSGKKTIELRRRFPISVPSGTTALIYATTPTRALLGTAEIGKVHQRAPEEIWAKFSEQSCIDRGDFDEYFRGSKLGYAIELRHAQRLHRSLSLAELRERFSFQPPQSFLYATSQMREALRHEYPEISH